MATVSLKKNEAGKSVEEHKKLPASNPFDALCDEDSGDDVISKAVVQLKQTTMSEPDENNKFNGSNNDNGNNNVQSRGGYRNNSRYPNMANGLTGAGQRRGFNGYNNRYQNGWYRGNGAKGSIHRSNGTDDGASDKAERSSVKSERELAEEEFQRKLEEFKYNPEEEEKHRNVLAKFSVLIAEKEEAVRKLRASDKADQNKVDKAVADRDKIFEDKRKALEYIRLSDCKKMTLDEFEKMNEEKRKALQAPKVERRVVQSSDFDNLVVVAKKNFEEDSLSIMPVHKPVAKATMEAEKTEKVQKGKKKTMLFSFGGSQSQGLNFPQQRDMYKGRPVHRRQGQSSVKQNGAVSSPSSKSSENFPALGSEAGA